MTVLIETQGFSGDELRGTKIKGVDYVEEVKKTLNREARGEVVFRGYV